MLLLVGLIILLLFALVSKENKQAKERTNQKKIEQIREEIKDIKQEVKQIEISKAATAKKAAIPKPQPKQAVVYPVGCEKYRSEVSKYNWNVNVALAVMKAESGCNPNAVSPSDDHGLMQLHGIRIYDPAQNIAYAYNEKYMKGGWSHWTVCTKGLVSCW